MIDFIVCLIHFLVALFSSWVVAYLYEERIKSAKEGYQLAFIASILFWTLMIILSFMIIMTKLHPVQTV